MRGVFAAALALVLLTGCARTVFNEFDGSGRIRGSFALGSRALQDGWVEMIELTGPVSERCGPGDCGLSVRLLLAGEQWNAGRWQVVPPRVPGWNRPGPFVIVVNDGELTTVHADYERS
jgi:hypothetical protein